MAHPDRGQTPQPVRDDRGRDELDDFVLAFEEAYHDQGEADPAAFLPPTDHPLHRAVLRELVRVDLEFGWGTGRPKSLETYRDAFPELADDPDGLCEIAYEEFRLRRAAGQAPSVDEYRRRYGVSFEARSGYARSASRSKYTAGKPGDDDDDDPDEPDPGSRALQTEDNRGPGDRRSRSTAAKLPEVGDHFLGFRLLRELGRGSFGRVYLAQQIDLAARPVVLKVTADRHDESQTLAQLQHDHIVPIYSQHSTHGLRAVCMPYRGSVTLRDVLIDLKARNVPPDSGRDLISSLAKSSERKGVPGPETGVDTGTAGDGTPGGCAENAGGSRRAVAGASARGGAANPATAAVSTAASWPLSAVSSRLGRIWTRRPPAEWSPPAAAPAPDSAAAADRPVEASPRAWENLARLSYVEAVIWMAERVARGLAHAHGKGILHRDLKPANILLTDDGRPLLLDFNLAADLKRADRGEGSVPGGLGGTLPYMAPEHIEAFWRGGREADAAVDARSDVYALGVILYEMFTGHLPFPTRDVSTGGREALRAMVADRKAGTPPIRPYNPAVSPGVESIVRHCLEASPTCRYPSAQALADDLERYLAHAPLRHAPDPSGPERVLKWCRRNHRPILVAVAIAVLSALGVLLAAHRSRVAADEARAALNRFQGQAIEARTRLGLVEVGPAQVRAAIAAAGQALDEFHARDTGRSAWWNHPPASNLSTASRNRLRREVGELLLLLARTELRRGQTLAALDTNERAELAFDSTAQPRSLWLQRADLLASLKRGDEAVVARSRADRQPEPTAFDLLLEAQQQLDRSPRTALNLFDQAVGLDRADVWAWLGKGQALWQIGDLRGAASCFDTCLILAPDHPAAWFNLGLVHLRESEADQAAVAFEHALKTRPNDPDALFNRAIADLRRGRLSEAETGLGQALDHGQSPTRVHLARWRVRTLLGDRAGALHDLAEGLRREPDPDDVIAWTSRGLVKAELGRRTEALADLDHALAIAPHSREALRNKAVVLDQMGQTADAIATLDRVVARYPSDDDARIGRAVLLARHGRRDDAVADAERIADPRRQPTSLRLLQAACTYAQTSRIHPPDRARALELLGVVVRRDAVRPRDLETDPDLEPIRDDPAFGRLLAEARSSTWARRRRDEAVGPVSRPPAGQSTTDLPGSPTKAIAP